MRDAEQMDRELERVARRWQQLPLSHALRVCPRVREVAQRLADEAADLTGVSRRPVPDLGPAVLMDQLRVMLYDHAVAGGDPAVRASQLTDLRRALP